jgi:hypothetical protein
MELSQHFQIRTVVAKSVMLDLLPLDSVVHHRSLHALKSSEFKRDGVPLFELEFKCDIDTGRGPVLAGGKVEFVPTWSWALNRYELQVEFPDGNALVVARLEYDDQSLEHGLPRRCVYSVLDPTTEDILRQSTTTYRVIGSGNIRDEDCLLSAFDLPEPSLRARSKHSIWLVLANLIALTVLIIGFRLRQLSRQDRPAPSSLSH